MAAPTMASALLRIRGDASGALRALTSTKQGLGGVGKHLASIGRIAAGIVLARIFYAAVTAIQSFVTSLVSATAEMQRLSLSIQVLLSRELAKAATEARGLGGEIAHAGDYFAAAEAPAKAMMDQIKRFGLLSPYSIASAANMYKLALAFGWGSEMSLDLTKALLNTSAGLGLTAERSNRLAFNLLQLQTQGQLMQRDFREMGMVGYDLAAVLQEVSRTVGINIKDHLAFNKLLKRGKVTWEDFGNAIITVAERDFGPAAEKFATTLTGIKENLGDVANVISAVFLPTADLIGEWAVKALDWLLKLSESGQLDIAGENLRTWVEDLLFDIDFILKNAKSEGLSGIVDALTRLGKIEWGKGKDLEVFAESLEKLGTALKLLGTVSWDTVVGGLQQLFDIFATVDTPTITEAAAGVDRITSSINDIADTISEKSGAISGGIAAILGTLGLLAGVGVAAGIIGIFTGAITGALVPVLLALAAIGLLFFAVIDLSDRFDTLQDVLWAAREGLRNLCNLIWAIGVNSLLFWADTWDKAVLAARQCVAIIIALIIDWVNGVVGGFNAIWLTALRVVALILRFVSNTGMAIRAFWEKITTAAGQFVTIILAKLADLVFRIKIRWITFKYDLGTWLSNLVTIVKTKISDFVTAGKDVIQGLWDGLKAKWSLVITWLQNQINKIPDWIKSILGIRSPSKVFFDIGENMMAGLSEGIESASTNVRRTLARQMRQFSGTTQLQLAPTQALAGGARPRTYQTNKQITIAPGAIQITVGDKDDIMESTIVFEDSLLHALEEL